MTEPARNVTPKQVAIIAALLMGKTIEQAAAGAGASPSTAHRWLRDPVFVAELAKARRAALSAALDVLTAGARIAAGEILAILRDKKVAPSVRLRAAEAVLERLHKWAELEDLEARIRALEEKHGNS
jgi:hypothetical protein